MLYINYRFSERQDTVTSRKKGGFYKKLSKQAACGPAARKYIHASADYRLLNKVLGHG